MLLFVAKSIECTSDQCALKVKSDEARDLGQQLPEDAGHALVIGVGSALADAGVEEIDRRVADGLDVLRVTGYASEKGIA